MPPKSADTDASVEKKAVAMKSVGELTSLEGGTIKPEKKSSIFTSRDGQSLDFSNLSLSTKTNDPEKSPPKEILKGLSGSFAPKTLTAIMGPSGSGKTSLLKVLTGRMGKTSNVSLSGEIHLDHKIVDPTNIEVRREIAYVEQEISVPATCTPREAIAFSARLRLDKKLSDADIDDIVEDILDNLDLQDCADTIVGGGLLMKGGLSGGEKKRVQCGIELVTNPEIVVLDEPTSGLDSYSAQSLMEVLKKIANAGATVIVTIHQPPPPVVRKIDNLVMLLKGRILYNGSMDVHVENVFHERGYPKPDDYNIADWILEVAQTQSMEELEKAGFFGGETKKQQSMTQVNDQSVDIVAKAASALPSIERVGLSTQLRLLFGREIKKLLRDKGSLVVRLSSAVVFGILFGLVFFNVGKSTYLEYPEVMASFGAIANLLISTMFSVAQSALMEFPQDRPVFLREYSTNHYSILPYFLAKFTLECFTVLITVLMQQVAAFFLYGLQMNFFFFLGLNFMLAIASTSIGIFIGSCIEDPNVAAELMPALIVPQLLFSGFFIQVDLIPAFLRWSQYLCSLTYAIRLAALFEFGDCETDSCQDLLLSNGVYQLDSYWYWIILIAIAAVFRITSMIVLKNKASF